MSYIAINYYYAELKPDHESPVKNLFQEPVTKGIVLMATGEPGRFISKDMLGDTQCTSIITTIHPDQLKEHFNLIEVVECPHHFGEFHTPDSYCDKCYIEEKDKL